MQQDRNFSMRTDKQTLDGLRVLSSLTGRSKASVIRFLVFSRLNELGLSTQEETISRFNREIPKTNRENFTKR